MVKKKRKPRACSTCNTVGHDKRTCAITPADPKEREAYRVERQKESKREQRETGQAMVSALNQLAQDAGSKFRLEFDQHPPPGFFGVLVHLVEESGERGPGKFDPSFAHGVGAVAALLASIKQASS